MVSLGLLLTSFIGAGQAFLLVFIVGEGEATEGFLAAYSLYGAVALLGVSLRRSLVPLLGPSSDAASFSERAGELISRTWFVGAALGGAVMLCSPFVAPALTSGSSSEAERTALFTLLLLGPAVHLQIRAGSVSAMLNGARRFPSSVGLYVLSSLFALASGALFLAVLGPVGSALGVLFGACLLTIGHVVLVRRYGLVTRPRLVHMADPAQPKIVSFLMAGSALGIAQQLTLTLALGVLAAGQGSVTLYAYAYFLGGLMSNISSYSVALVTLPDSVELITRSGVAGARRQLDTVSPFVFAVLAPLLLGFLSFGESVLEGVFGGALAPESIASLYALAVSLEPMVIGVSVFVLGGTMLLALGWRGRAVTVAISSLGIHAIALWSVAGLGSIAVALAHSASTLTAALLVLVAVFEFSTPSVVAMLVRRALPAFAMAVVFPATALAVGSEPSLWRGSLGLIAATTLYALMLVRLWPDVGRTFLLGFGRSRPGHR